MSLARLFVMLILTVWYSFFLLRPITMIRADVGRHIRNGEILLSTPIGGWNKILQTNFYSYTNPDFSFINHHWGSGIIFYLIWKVAGLTGLAIFSISLNLLTFFIFFHLAKKKAGFYTASLVTLFLIPLIAERTEIRPEIFSYLLSAIFFWLLLRYRFESLPSPSEGRRGGEERWLLLLIPLQALWINLHIYFFLGIGIVGAFWIDAALCKDRIKLKWLTIILGATILASLINPSGLKGLLYPLQIFQNYAVPVSENVSVKQFALEHPGYANMINFKIAALIFGITWLLLIIKNKKKLPFYQIALGLFFTIVAYRSVRNLTIFAFFSLPLISAATYHIIPWEKLAKYTLIQKKIIGGLIIALVLLAVGLINRQRIGLIWDNRYLGLQRGEEAAAQFILQNNIKGPLFNDFDAGSYVIYFLYPKMRPFIDNRPEAFPAEFVNNTYVPLHTEDKAWRDALAKYSFNTILYAFDDKAPFALPFIVNRLLDPEWAPVFADKYYIVFVKRGAENAEVIRKYEIPQDRFSLSEEK